MDLHAKCLPHCFESIKQGRKLDVRQFETITFQNSVSGECLTFRVEDIVKLDKQDTERLRHFFPGVRWDDTRPSFGIWFGSPCALDGTAIEVRGE